MWSGEKGDAGEARLLCCTLIGSLAWVDSKSKKQFCESFAGASFLYGELQRNSKRSLSRLAFDIIAL